MNRPVVSTRIRPRLLAGIAAAAAGLIAPRAAAAADAPDVIVLMLNDARDGDQVGLPRTIARFEAEGTTFSNFFLTTPLCCPSRASVLTGLYAHNTGVYENSDGKHGGWLGFAKRGNRSRTTGVLLQNAGYRTVTLGTYLNGEQPGKGIEAGWDIGPRARRKKHRKQGGKGKRKRQDKTKKKGQRGAIGDGQAADIAIAELRTTPVEQPLYLHIGFGTPHVPANPVPPYAGQFAGAQIDRDASFNEADISDKPHYLRKLGRLSGNEEAWLDGLHQRRLECLLQLDEAIARIWEAVEARGKAGNTYVFLFTDNGYLLGQHRHYGKHVPYDGSARMPLYACGPGFAAGATDQRLVGNVDLAPTLAAVAGVSPPAMDGASLLSPHDRDAILLEFLAPGVNTMKWPGPRTEISRYSAVRTETHLYVEHRSGERELYDYQADPHETTNLLAGTPSPAAAAVAASLGNRLDQLRGCRGASCL